MAYVTLAESFIRRLVGKGVTLEYAFLNQAKIFMHSFLIPIGLNGCSGRGRFNSNAPSFMGGHIIRALEFL